MWPIEKRCRQHHTRAWVAPETVDLLGQKMIGLVGDRRMTKAHRYLGEGRGTPELTAGLRVWHGGYGGPTTVRPGLSAGISFSSRRRLLEGIGFSVREDSETEDQIAERYDHPERQWLGQRRDITLVELTGWPGEPSSDDSIRIEFWNEHGVGQETLIAFDDVNLVQELAWAVKGDKVREMHLDDEFCTSCGQHVEDPGHDWSGSCVRRRATLAENLALLAAFAAQKEAIPAAEPAGESR